MEELFTPEGNEIYLKPSAFYCAGSTEPVAWLDICAQASEAEEVAIGVYSKDGKCSLNPPQDMSRVFTADDSIIVVADSDDEHEYDD